MGRHPTCQCGDCKKCKHREYMRSYYYRSERWSGGVVTLECRNCGGAFEATRRAAAGAGRGHGRAFCSRKCKDVFTDARRLGELHAAKPDRWCPHCGVMLANTKRADAAFCSEKCEQSAHNATRKASAKIGARQERIDRAYIIQRDSKRCHLCRRRVPDALITLDHVIPLAKGGTHTAENLRVACLPCNTRKRAEAANEQLMLVG